MKKKKLVPLPKLLKKTQDIVNKFVRERDLYDGCISCGGQVDDAGHYFSRGHNGALRYNITNIHGQCKKCNLFLRGNLINYRMGLVKRYGEDYVKKLESLERNFKRWNREELESIINQYKKQKA